MSDIATLPAIAAHGARRLPSVDIDSYNVELKDDEGFLGDRASKGAFRGIIENWRKPLRKKGADPFGDTASDDLTKKQLDQLLTKGDPEAAGILQGAIEDFAQELALVIRRFLKLKGWRDTERSSWVAAYARVASARLAIGRASVLLTADKLAFEWPIRNHPDEAGLLGTSHLTPAWMIEATTRSCRSTLAAPTSAPASSK